MYPFWKRFLDIALSLTGIIMTLPLQLLLALLIKLDSPGGVIFRQERLGRGGKVFKMYKFRSMCVNAEHTGSGVYSSEGDSRVTRVGKFMRATSLDELPQLFNMLKGDMSLIGPRPPLTYHPWEFEKYTEEERHMFDVRPGLTGYAQVHGRNNVPWPERIALNVWYARHMSFALDARIFLTTIFKVALMKDHYSKARQLEER